LDTQTNLGVDWMHLTGRLFLACVFAASAYDKFLRVPGEVQVVTSLHIPAPRTVLVRVGVFETLGALALVIGIYARQASVLLALFMVVISLAVLRFFLKRLCRYKGFGLAGSQTSIDGGCHPN
jgi:putative oxidoreductase